MKRAVLTLESSFIRFVLVFVGQTSIRGVEYITMAVGFEQPC